MEVSNNLISMRVSPILVAFLAAATTLGVSNTAEAKPGPAATDKTTADATIAHPRAADIVVPASAEGSRSPAAIAKPEVIVQAQPGAPTTQPSTVAPAPDGTPPAQSPPAGVQTPEQETPNQIQIPTTPTPDPSPTPSVPPETQQAPAAPSQPAPTTPITPPQPTQPPQSTEPEPQVLVAEVAVRAESGTLSPDLENEIYQVIRTQAGRTTTRSQLQEDINAIFKTGYFFNVRAIPEDTPLGVRVTFAVQVNPVLQSVRVEGAQVLPEAVVQAAFSNQYGSTLNLNRLDEGIQQVNKWYRDNGYVLAQIANAPRVTPEGVVTLEVAEGVIEDIQVRFVDKEGRDIVVDKQGNPVRDKEGNPVQIRGRTRPYIVTREFELKPGEVFNRAKAERDLQRVFGLGIFEDVRLSLNPGTDPRKVDVVANVTERNTGNLAVGAGISSASGLFGTVSYQQQNFGGNNQRLGVEFQGGLRELLFDLNFTDPWIGGDPYRTSYTINLFRRRTISLIFDGGERDVDLPNGDTPRVVRTGGGISFSRPLNGNPYRRAEWTASLGLQYQRVQTVDRDGEVSPVDELGNQLSFSGEGKDDLFSIQFGLVRDLRDNPLRPIRGSLLRVGTEQTIPIGLGSILLNRLRGSYSVYLPTRILQFTEGCRKARPTSDECPQTFAFNVQAGTVVGDLPPYEAFSLGGSNSVRGYDEGDVGSARSFVLASAEYRFPLFSIISGAVFLDAATDFGSGDNVLGRPGEVREKPGGGIGYGLGLRVQSPLGPIRIDYGFNDQGDSRLHFGIGERF